MRVEGYLYLCLKPKLLIMKKIGKLRMDSISDYIRIWTPKYDDEELIRYEKSILLIAFDNNNDYFLDNMTSDWEITEIESIDKIY